MKVHPEYSHVLYKGIENIKHDKISAFDDIKYIDSNGKVIDAKVGSVPFKINNNIFKLSVIKTMEDIKNIKKLKKKIIERDKHDKMKMEFFVNMSHELKTPLNLIFTSTQLIESLYNKNKLGGESIKNHINLTKQNSYRLLKIINDLIEFTRMETGFYHVNLINKDIILVIEDIVMSVVDYAKSKGVQIIFDTDVEELTMAIDVNALEIIVLNLLSNAIKFTDKDGYIYVNMIYKENENKIDIRIEDTGIGIEEDKLNLIFKRFNNVNKGFVGNINGSGIGLSMIKSLSNLINAKISVESEYGKGSIFTISLNISHKKEDDRNSNYKVKKNEPLNVERLVVGMEDIYNV
ncbi:Autoinducer 2 sensor kinase/phosphatase LuxQ [bioreactor metagenome]|uniref:Autoinducer 2 sensor kinase/phosphatase LuxQ n=1 Tax=bioreactor metagenome TaxID=1076179 RepID=A0A645DEK7_9ZZZZ